MRRYELDINGKHVSIAVLSFSMKRAELEVEGTRYTVNVEDVIIEGAELQPVRLGSTARPLPSTPGQAKVAPPPGRGTGIGGGGASPGAGSVVAPIPGQILAVLVKEGDTVVAGQALVKIEAMKMENMIIAPVAGTVGAIGVNVGDAVTQGQELLVIG
jgi:glutaconyl-CoA/methylmalonyl-CoA decarboxylase subunit gamma